MFRIQKILVPVDFSASSKKAVYYGISLALEFNARLVLAHILMASPYWARIRSANLTAFDRQEYDEAKSRLSKLIPPECREDLNSEIIVKAGDVRQELFGIVEDRDIDLVIMGSHGRSYFGRLLLGSVTERMLRKLHVPVLTVSHLSPEKEIHGPEPVPLRRILYATDLSEGSDKGLNLQEKGRIERVVLGTTAERVIRTSPVPVLSLPLPTTYESRWAAA